MGSIRRVIWKCIWVCSFCTLGITVIYKDGVVIKLESIWGGVEDKVEDKGEDKGEELKTQSDETKFKDPVKLGLSPSTKVEYWDCR
jgi:hypothetical protein